MIRAVKSVFSSPGFLIGGFMRPEEAPGHGSKRSPLDHGMDMDAMKQVRSPLPPSSFSSSSPLSLLTCPFSLASMSCRCLRLLLLRIGGGGG